MHELQSLLSLLLLTSCQMGTETKQSVFNFTRGKEEATIHLVQNGNDTCYIYWGVGISCFPKP